MTTITTMRLATDEQPYTEQELDWIYRHYVNHDGPGFCRKALATFESFDIEDITDGDVASVIVDTLCSEYTAREEYVLGQLGVNTEFYEESEDGNWWDVEPITDYIADRLNNLCTDERFHFSWYEGGYYLFLSKDIETKE